MYKYTQKQLCYSNKSKYCMMLLAHLISFVTCVSGKLNEVSLFLEQSPGLEVFTDQQELA